MNFSSLAFDTEDELKQAADLFLTLKAPSRKLLAELVECSEIVRQKRPVAADALEDQGLCFVRESKSLFFHEVKMAPSLKGEEILAYLSDPTSCYEAASPTL